MKFKILLIAVMAIVSSCEKSTFQDGIQPGTEQAVTLTNDYIKSQKWLIIGASKFNGSEVKIWKIQSEDLKTILIINPAPAIDPQHANYYVGDSIDGAYVLGLNIQPQ